MAACNPEYAWSLTTPPVLEPFTIADAKAQIRSVQVQEDGVIAGYIKAARSAAESYLSRGLLTQSWTLALSEFVDLIPLPMAAPLQSVTTVKYYDVSGVQQTLASSGYTVDTRWRPGRVALAANTTWPSIQTDRKVNRIEIEYIVGWTTRELIPEDIRQGMRLFIGLCDVDRDGMGQGTDQALRVAKAFWTDRVFYVPPQYEAIY